MVLPILSQVTGLGAGGASGRNGVSQTPDLSFPDISFLTFEAVIEVVIICFTGFLAAKTGLLTVEGQKIISKLNVDLFTPCLVFTKLAPSLSLQKMADVIVIPIFYAFSTGIAYICSRVVSGMFSLNEPETDFVTAMAVFGNSNSLPVSLTLSLAYTLPDLLWDDIDDDSAEKVASRGILYLLIFQQLGQILRWSWGYNKLLRKRSCEELNAYGRKFLVANDGYISSNNNTVRDLVADGIDVVVGDGVEDDEETRLLLPGSRGSTPTVNESLFETNWAQTGGHGGVIGVADGGSNCDHISRLQNAGSSSSSSMLGDGDDDETAPVLIKAAAARRRNLVSRVFHSISNIKVVRVFLEFMNPPLWAMLLSVIVASVPQLQHTFFEENGTFIANTLTKSVSQLGSVSIPLILIVLGLNLYPSKEVPPASKHHSRIILSSLLSRMILPSIIILPIIALTVKFVKLSILDDPIFLIVAFILTISPPAIQLSQIVQINHIYQKEMAGVLFWGYVILTLPTTILIVATSLEVLKWAE